MGLFHCRNRLDNDNQKPLKIRPLWNNGSANMEYKFVQNGMRVDFFDYVKKSMEQKDEWDIILILG
ncbi:hypothetical protein OQJ19_04460 [Fluoribacter gormanii]|uniref:hypothetical protein n=1 Tax=Fluoribacter gormanii TaxID=464 RepID=UPI0022434A25|nr:hypothetical protein [Fluoribacter gormanii]MCW8469909.1 hypothetical protein [Fluoribacter gormanii]